MSIVRDSLDAFGKRVQQQSRANLTKIGKKDTGDLYNSIGYEVAVHKNSFHMSFKMTDYAPFIDKGVKGIKSGAKAYSSPFNFGSGRGPKGGMRIAIDGWVRRKRIQFKNRETGRFMSYKTTAFIITKSVYNKGLPTTNFFTTPFEKEFKKLPDEVVQAYGLEVNKLMKFVFKK